MSRVGVVLFFITCIPAYKLSVNLKSVDLLVQYYLAMCLLTDFMLIFISDLKASFGGLFYVQHKMIELSCFLSYDV